MTVTIRRAAAFACLFLACLALAQAPAAMSPDATGGWEGAIQIPGMPLEVSVVLSAEDGDWSGTIDIPAQGAIGLPLQDVRIEDGEATFAIAGTPGEPTFEGTIHGDAMSGTFSQSGQSFPFELQRVEAEAGDGAAEDAEDAAPADGAAAPADGPDAPIGPAAPAPAAPDAPAPEAGAGDEAYEHPGGRFSFPVPAGWEVREAEDHVVAVGPDEGVRIAFAEVEEEDLEAAIDEAWARFDPAFDLEPDETLEPPSDPGIERTIVANYDPEDDERVLQAVAQLHEGTAYVILVDAELAALQRRAAQLQIVTSGFRIAAVEETDLEGAPSRTVADVEADLAAFAEAQLDAFDVPGAAIAVVEGGEIAWAEGFGTTRTDDGEPITPTTRMMIGSTGKTMTSALVATLVDDGTVGWDTPVVEVLPEFEVADPELTETITLRNLLCACTGVPRRDYELFFNADDLTAEAVVDSLGTFEFFTDFGEVFQYSNQLVATAGYAAAAAAGAEHGELFEGYVRALEERILGPIGLEDTTLSFEDVVAAGDHAVPHQQDLESGGYEPIDLEYERIVLPVGPAGAHWSTAEDMGRWMITLLAGGVAPDGDRIVSEEALEATWEPQVPVSATESYGLGWLVGEYKGLEWLYHSGNTLGFTSEFVFVPEADVGIVVLANAQGANAFAGAVAVRLFELLYDQPSEAAAQAEFVVRETERSLQEAREQLQDRVPAEEAEPFLGRWSNPALGEVVLETEGEQLTLDAGEFRTEIRPILDRQGEPDGWVTYGAPVTGLPIELERGEDGAPSLVLGEGAISYTFERVEE